MILDLDRTTLELVRGDTFTLPLELNCGSRENFIRHTLDDSECLFVGIAKPNQSFEDAEIRGGLNKNSEKDSSGNVIFKLMPEHTVNLCPGKYYFTVKFTRGKDVYTLVDNKIFFVTGSYPSEFLR